MSDYQHEDTDDVRPREISNDVEVGPAHADQQTPTEGTEKHIDAERNGHNNGQVQLESGRGTSAAREKPYSVFSTNEKRVIVLAGSLAGFFSPLSSSIYFPALDTIAKALNVSDSNINLTVTTYLILQGLAPMMIAGFSDNMGRRPAYMLCFTIYIFANLGLGLQNSYASLLGLRCLQSAGSSGTIALANGLVGDTVTSEQRGAYIAFASLGGLLGPTLSPIIGGLISQNLDWHWLFWFLLIFSGVFAVPLFLFLPETCRKIVGDGSIPPPPLNMSLTDVIRHRRRAKKGRGFDEAERGELRKNYRFRFPNPIATLWILFDPASLVILVTTGLNIACFYAISTGASSAFRNEYGLNDIEIGLVFIPIGVGGLLSALTTGKLIDWNYQRHARRLGITVVKGVRQDLTDFPIEKARIQVALPLLLLNGVFVIAYGWTVDHKVSLAGPIIFLFILGYCSIASYQAMNVLMTDIWPGQAAAATAANNFIRCELGAAASAAISPMSKAFGQGWAYTFWALVYMAFAPALLIISRRGIQMRKAKKARGDKKLAQRKEIKDRNG
ncbi:hypothetical protein PV08_01409 [Exophiala spinifera]|uniref:Major facilitator superfamily (MFS) profile domain-containing protein n=1 Tax=Exophiala spinifera TaxID=91928 RepID=A0A0D1YZT1_9EURO|nr:uncharacterized protein PV08_01409 [Exophiala spinifera]KIW20831.1 hypothetical protein PV08_01409 [Exophiala spinifera]